MANTKTSTQCQNTPRNYHMLTRSTQTIAIVNSNYSNYSNCKGQSYNMYFARKHVKWMSHAWKCEIFQKLKLRKAVHLCHIIVLRNINLYPFIQYLMFKITRKWSIKSVEANIKRPLLPFINTKVKFNTLASFTQPRMKLNWMA